MNLFLLKPRVEWGFPYDKAHGFVVRADNPSNARALASLQAGDEGRDAWMDPRKTYCHPLHHEGGSGIILRDFNAG